MAERPRRESAVEFEIHFSYPTSQLSVSRFRLTWFKNRKTSVSLIGGTIAINIKHGQIEGTAQVANELRPRLAAIGILLEEEASRRGNDGGSWGSMEYDFDVSPERAQKNFHSTREAYSFISSIGSAIGCVPFHETGWLNVEHSFEILGEVKGKKRWMEEAMWLHGRFK